MVLHSPVDIYAGEKNNRIFGQTASWCFYLVINDIDNNIKENHTFHFASSNLHLACWKSWNSQFFATSKKSLLQPL